MNDWELFDAMNEAERKFLNLQEEFHKRGLHNKSFVEYSRHLTPLALDGAIVPDYQQSFPAEVLESESGLPKPPRQ